MLKACSRGSIIVQLTMPRGQEPKARAFFGEVLGMTEIEKPPILAERR